MSKKLFHTDPRNSFAFHFTLSMLQTFAYKLYGCPRCLGQILLLEICVLRNYDVALYKNNKYAMDTCNLQRKLQEPSHHGLPWPTAISYSGTKRVANQCRFVLCFWSVSPFSLTVNYQLAKGAKGRGELNSCQKNYQQKCLSCLNLQRL